MTDQSPDYTIGVVARTLDLLEALADADEPVGATELARRLGATKSSVFRILATLEQRGYVAKDEETNRYRLGVRLPYLGGRALRSLDLRQVARPALEHLYYRFRETVNLGVLDGTDIVYIDMIESDHTLRMTAQLGGRHPAYSTSIGKALLAYLPLEERSRHLPPRLEPRTGRTIADFARLDAELERVRRCGVAEDRGENEAGARCFGAAIFDHRGAPVAAISVSGPESRLGAMAQDHIEAVVRQAAAAVTQKLGGHVPTPVTQQGVESALASGASGGGSEDDE